MKNGNEFIKNLPWLFLGLLFFYLSGSSKPVEAAVWLTPVFAIRFFRKVKPVSACLIILPLWIIVDLLSNKGLTPFPSFSILLIVTTEIAVFTLLPYFLDRIFYKRLPIPYRLFLLPSLVIAIPFIRGAQGTWFNIANKIDNLTIVQIVSLVGISGISFLIFWTAVIINEIWENWKNPHILRNLIIVFLATITLVYGFGTMRLRSEYQFDKSILAAGIIQDPSHRDDLLNTLPLILRSNRSDPQKLENIRHETKTKFFEILSNSVAMADSGFQIAVWPEGAVILFKSDEQSLLRTAMQKAKEKGIYLGISALVYMDNEDRNKKGIRQAFDNKFILISPEGKIEFEYSKSILAPGMEAAVMIPGNEIMKISNKNNIRITTAICYELDFPLYIRQASMLKANLILGPSNDWTEIKYMHYKSARLRAIENGISLFRPVTNGISIAADPYGRILAQVDTQYSKGAPFSALVPINTVKTVYSQLGNFFKIISTAIAGFCIAISIRNIIKRKKA